MPAIKKETKKAVTTKKTAKRAPRKTASTKTKAKTEKTAAPRKAPAKNKIAIRRVASQTEGTSSVKKEPETELELVADINQGDQEMNSLMKDFHEDHVYQTAGLPLSGLGTPSSKHEEVDEDDEENEQDEEDYYEEGSDNEDEEEEEAEENFRAEFKEKIPQENPVFTPSQKIRAEEEYLYNNHLNRSVSVYRKIAYFFVALVAALLVFIFFFSVVKTTIVLIPDQERVQNNVVFDIYDQSLSGAGEKAIKGIVKKVDLEDEKDFPATGKKVIGQEAVGKVIIYNNYNKNQPLVATTRLLSSDNKLFRIKETVNVPAGGSAEAEIYADDPTPESEIGPSRFSIPGLWAGLQDKIYAESKEGVVYQKKTQNLVTKEDVDGAIRELKQSLTEKAQAQLTGDVQFSEVIYNVDENSITTDVDAKVDEEKDGFKVKIKGSVVVVAFDGKQALDLAKQKLNNSVSTNEEILSFSEDIDYALTNFDLQQGTASINATFEGKVSLKENSQIINKEKIVGLKKDQLEAYLSSLSGISGYEVKFYPSFIKKVPKLTDRIDVQIKKQ